VRLPPLNAVRAFDAVARLGSVRAAAEELAVTPAAVSQQLRVLEANLGLPLTQRDGRGIALTEAGRHWHGEVARHLRAIAEAAERVRPGRRVVQVTVVPSFGSRWLLPRLPLFTAWQPEIEVRIEASANVVDLSRDAFDLAIREGKGVSPEAESVLLFPLEVLVLASPSYVRMLKGKGRHVDWSRARLLHEVNLDFWPSWVAAMGVEGVDVARGLYFSHTMMTLDAAVDGQGVTLSPRCLAERELQRKQLVQVDPRSFLPGRGYYLAWARRSLRPLSPAAVAFRDWVIEQAQENQNP
jgi:LysR family transcriptional regulator, glycine cleavage system transcriptional activator